MPRFCVHLGYLFTELPMADRFAAAAAAGFSAVEHPNPYSFGIAAFGEAAQTHGLSVAQIAAPSGDAGKAEKGFACLAERRAAFRDSVVTGIDAAITVDAPLLHIMPGILPDGAARTDCRDTYLENLTWAAERCAENDLAVLVEPISDETVPGFYVNHPDFAATLLTDLGHPHARMLFDVYHAAVKGVDPQAFIETHFDLISHIQIADHPARHEPGTGTLPFAVIFELLDELGFTGWVGCEYEPLSSTQKGLGWLDEALS